MSREEFLDCTPRYFDALIQQHRSKQMQSEMMIAQLCAITANFSMRAPVKPVSPMAFVLTKPESEPKPRKPSQQQIAQKLRAVLFSTGQWETAAPVN